jgi:hypothetical protein
MNIVAFASNAGAGGDGLPLGAEWHHLIAMFPLHIPS